MATYAIDAFDLLWFKILEFQDYIVCLKQPSILLLLKLEINSQNKYELNLKKEYDSLDKNNYYISNFVFYQNKYIMCLFEIEYISMFLLDDLIHYTSGKIIWK